jgi:hypothetical protein
VSFFFFISILFKFYLTSYQDMSEVMCGLCFASGMASQELACMNCAGKGTVPAEEKKDEGKKEEEKKK